MAGLFTDFFNPFERVASNQNGMVGKSVSRGSLISFNYPNSLAINPNIIHDPYPLVIITDVWPSMLRGVNLHYLTFPYIKHVLQGNCGNSGYSYYNVKADKYIANAFRVYYRQGMSLVKKMDCDFLLNLMGAVRSWSPSEMNAVRQAIKQQIQNQLQAKAKDLADLDLQLNKSQQEQVRQKSVDMQNAIQGGAIRNLIYPQEHQIGQAPANKPLPEGGQYSTDNMLEG